MARPRVNFICSIDNCDRQAKSKGLCKQHYESRRLRLKAANPSTPRCSLDGCDNPVRSRGWCSSHYYRWREHGDVMHKPKIVHGSAQTYFFEVVLKYEGDDCLIWPFCKGAHGYGDLRLNGKRETVSRLACKLVHGEPPAQNYDAAHTCGQGAVGCCNPKHLYWATRKQNVQDTIAHGRHARGEQQVTSKLTEDRVREIKQLLKAGKLYQHQIADMYGVSRSAILKIHLGKCWAWLE